MLLVSLLLLWLAIAKQFGAVVAKRRIGFGGLLSNIPEVGTALGPPEVPAGASFIAGQLAVIAAS